nr:hypothetical protein [Streptomyces sp. NBRC 110028]
MRGVRHELPLPSGRFVESGEQIVESGAEALYLVRTRWQVESPVQVGGGDLGCLAAQLFHRPQSPTGDVPSGGGDQGGEDREAEGQFGGEPGDVVFDRGRGKSDVHGFRGMRRPR